MTGGPEPGVPESYRQSSGRNDRGVPRGYTDSEAALGGADAVPGTNQVPGHGTEPEQRYGGYGAADRRAKARVGPGTRGIGVGYWIVGALVIIVALIYAIGLIR